MSAPMFHDVVAGHVEDAVKHGLTVKAKCGLVWIPTVTRSQASNELEDCPDCFVELPAFVYRCYDAEGRLLYVGCSKAPVTRMTAHKRSTWWWPQVARVANTVFPSKGYALGRESVLIDELAPLWNVVGAPYSRLTAEDFEERLRLAEEFGAPEKVVRRLTREYVSRYGLQAVRSA